MAADKKIDDFKGMRKLRQDVAPRKKFRDLSKPKMNNEVKSWPRK
jgi:hypothetical protein